MQHKIHIKRIYEPASAGDGARILVDRLWPRGISKANAALTLWFKDIAPTPELRKWFGHDPGRFDEFRQRYEAELAGNPQAIAQMEPYVRQGDVTLLYAAHDPHCNHALVLADFLRSALG
ncbi:DUF488 domain-containing protein [Kerstersia gyiorum]|jgi:uncharacterized protein YeaO (DUF488 family)|uniref:Uroporphyrin-III methyltransferase n=1 Tax=Kerstersia gyiorum TaxID=206506 RepID=A0A171KNC6_9BURK|nr:DUF488 domain-containing protein [Kerstersia gyiorum]KKO70393.1 uroporphyrin-III methyltransferase [Kerstersia gyiorum]MCH4272681.1 DUF488 domain-containing protein [Kerstersia gyiorum]MCI1230048.1 DUF488 domain-containing protein [Kerstersia gyiorum]MCP1633936.1 uncharacterized protein YeaO (DUF488 family) [Kerstersia gyiorum]MCP1637404.1 uncharacterized protein YeaO (DUF488 family) [Kerstersia gyiorum]